MGWTKQLGDGRWRAFESEGSGAGRVQANAVRAKKRDAQTAARAMLAKKLGADLEPHRLTLKAYLERWTAHLATQNRGAKSLARYESICDRLPARISGRLLADVRPLQLQKWLDDSELAPATVRKHYAVLHAAFAQAVAWRLLPENPMASVRRPPLERREVRALDERGTADLLASLQGTRYWAPAVVAATTGMRRGNLLALRWQDVDLDAGVVRIRKKLDEVPGKVHVRDGDKARKTRTLALMAATVTALRAHKKAQAAEKLAAKKWREHGLVFPDRRGYPWRPSTFSVGWGRLDTGLRFHDLRHTHATLMLRAGVPVDAVSKRLGHATPVVTMTVYSHVLEDADAAAVERLEEGLGGALAGDSATSVATSPAADSAK